MTVSTSWPRIAGWLAAHHPTTATLINPPATAVDLRYLEAAVNRPLPADLVELLELANGTEHRAVRGSLIPTLYNLVPVKDMLSNRQMLQKIQRHIHGSGPWPGDGQPAGRPTTDWLDSFLPIAVAGDAGLLYVDLRDGDQFGCVWEWYAEGGGASAPWWNGVGEMLDDVAGAFVDRRPALQSYSSGAVWPEKRLSPRLADLDDGYLRWSAVWD
ncbi:cell wall assembly regulator SMI1 [Kribbella voronezhensis]|uniref:Cell wall assembly regulator SMI1 n=1 Tax=Kribbella voronezhensis TaxID=2512212 RepID=A0A4R7T8D5_9ACTN|nr:SMI1/KNR4 family protein [Kribbella voronezhensis]TDU87428.1 cell wall assembly regulator SMI1 [Kribbella voronezhensis]